MSETMPEEIDNPPAFPQSREDLDPRNEGWIGGGMSLRDYLAAKAMQAIVASTYREVIDEPPDLEYEDTVAASAYRISDAMLAERSKR